MTSRERVLAALNHQEPDRIPVTLAYETPEGIRQRYGQTTTDFPMRQDVFLIGFQQPPPPVGIRERYFADVALPEGTTFNAWGFARWRSPTGESMETVGPLRNAESVGEIDAYPWPRFDTQAAVADLTAQIADMHRQGFAVQGGGGSIFEYSWYLFGFERMLMELASESPMILRLLDKITEVITRGAVSYARAGGDILRMGDDIADQRGMMMAPDLWRRTLKPRLASVIAAAREVRPDLPVFYHSDGNVGAVIEDLIEAGVTILNPVQPEAIDPLEVKRRYGDRITLWGTIGTQTVMPFYTPQEVRRTVKEYCAVLGKGGGYVIAPTHSIEKDVPWDNIEAFYRAVEDFGVYR